jgi:predicted nucleic acid-binding protein
LIYLDTSVVVPVFLPDVHSSRVGAWFRTLSEAPTVSHWTAAEFSSAAAIQERIGQIDRDQRLLAEQGLDVWLLAVEQAAVLRADFELARDLIRYGPGKLRAPDALHVAIARRIGARLATLDVAMHDAALDAGLALEAI